jgi:pimeloyl-ACP methyl ester carboxylesterase
MQIVDQGYFFAGGRYVEHDGATVCIGQMFVQYQIPAERKQKFPVVMIHGGSQTGTNFLGTPDGREGWADYFLGEGYAVYVVDQPGRGRSGYFPSHYGKPRRQTVALAERRFTAPAVTKLWPQAHLHTRWPGSGQRGDPIFDQFFSSQVESIEDGELTECLVRDAGVALLERIGPAILLTHSQSGPFGWAIADARPDRVKGILAIEPNGPPVHELNLLGAPKWFEDGALTYRKVGHIGAQWLALPGTH